MADIQLSKSNKFLLRIIYKSYLKELKSGVPKSDARWLGSSDEIQKHLLPKWSKNDVAISCWELHSQGLLKCSSGDNIAYTTYLTDKGISYMETHKFNKAKNTIDWILKLKP